MNRPQSGILKTIVVILLCLVTLGTIGGFLGRSWWLFEVAGLFRLQFFLVSVILGIFLALSGRPGYTILCFLLACINAFNLAPSTSWASSQNWNKTVGYETDSSRQTYKVIVANVQELEQEHLKMAAYFKAEDPDFLLILEADPPWIEAMSFLEEEYPYYLLEPRWSGHGIALYSKVPWESTAVWDIVGVDRPALVASLTIEDQPLTIIGMHPYPPVSSQQWSLRNEELAQVADFIQQQPGTVMLLGDLNVTHWSPTFKDMITTAGLENGRSEFGHLATWPAIGSIAWLPFDHILTTPDLTISKLERGPNIGTDHLPLAAEISYTR
jgi:endonuclease/exonuclease/phosphatase (EEP) superfamily protein YafD